MRENDGEVLKCTSCERCVSQSQLALLQVLVVGWGKVLEVLGMNNAQLRLSGPSPPSSDTSPGSV